MGKIFTNDPPFYQQLRAIAIPVAVQNLITVGVSMLDTLMLGSMGEVQLSASSLANQWFFMLTVINFGLAGGANVLVAGSAVYGAEDIAARIEALRGA